MRRNKGIIQLLPLLGVAFLVAGLVTITSSANQVTNFLNKAADNVSFRSSLKSQVPTVPPVSLEEWKNCVNTSGSRILQTYPAICVNPDGKRIVEPSSQIPSPTSTPEEDTRSTATPIVSPTPSSVSWEGCIGTSGSIILQTYPRICAYPDGRKVTESIVIALPTSSPYVVPTPTSTPPPYTTSTPSASNIGLNVSRNRSTTPPPQNVSWLDCITTPGSIILQTYPGICRYPDGRQVTESISTNPTPRVERSPMPSSECGGFKGLLCPSGTICIYSDGSSRAPYPDASGYCQSGSLPSDKGSWDECISTKGSRTLQVFPGVCVYPDGRKVSQPTRSYASGNVNAENRATTVMGGVKRIINSITTVSRVYFQRFFR